MLLSDQPKINFALGVHNHQPFGNWDWIVEEAYQHAYSPFLEALERHSGVRVTLHYTGYLLEWLIAHHPDFIARLKNLVDRRQVELITGGFYAPVLAVIPDADKVRQVERLTRLIEDRFGTTPEGLWLAERVWEPHLVKPISESGVRWTALDDTIFKGAGLRGAQLFGYYQTEEQGRTLEVVPINSELMALIPYAPPERAIDYLKANASPDGNRFALCLGDGEKFGVWPNSYRAVFEHKWLDRFFDLLTEHADWIVSTTVRDYRAERRPFGRVYLPSATYPRMQEWSLPPDEATRFAEARQQVDERFSGFLRGGMWRNFLVRYPESNNLHKKMLLVASKVAAASQVPELVPSGKGPAIPSSTLTEAQDLLWKGQSNDPYWHGVFGGLYLSHLRSANYRALIKAESLCDELIHQGSLFLDVTEQDFDCDGKPEILISNAAQNAYFNLEGGALFELDYKPRAYNVLDTLARRPEAYHGKIARATTLEAFKKEGSLKALYDVVLTKEAGLEKFLFNDWYRRMSFVDHFLHPDSHLESFYNMSYGEQGDFVNQDYRATVECDGLLATLTLVRDGHVWVGPEFWPIQVEKRIAIPRDGARLSAHYRVTNGKDRPVALWFGVEFNANFLAGNAPDRYYHTPGTVIEDPRLGSKGELRDCRAIGLRDAYNGLDYHLEWDRPATLWRFPVETISMSEGGVERVYQSSVVMPHWRFELGPGETLAIAFQQRMSDV